MVGDVVDFERENARLPNIRTARCHTTCRKGKDRMWGNLAFSRSKLTTSPSGPP